MTLFDMAWVVDVAHTARPLSVTCRACHSGPGTACYTLTRPRAGMDGTVTHIRRGRAPHDERRHDAYWSAISEAILAELSSRDAEALAAQTRLRGMSVDQGAAILDLAPPRELVIAWVMAARHMLGDAPNYSETEVTVPAGSASMTFGAAGEERYTFTVQRAGRLTPHQARRRAEARVAELEVQLAALQQ